MSSAVDRPGALQSSGSDRPRAARHSDRNASSGSTRDARRAGSAMTASATTAKAADASAKVAGSAAPTPKRRVDTILPSASDTPTRTRDQRPRVSSLVRRAPVSYRHENTAAAGAAQIRDAAQPSSIEGPQPTMSWRSEKCSSGGRPGSRMPDGSAIVLRTSSASASWSGHAG